MLYLARLIDASGRSARFLQPVGGSEEIRYNFRIVDDFVVSGFIVLKPCESL